MAVMLVNQSKFGNSGQKAKAADNLRKRFEKEQFVSFMFYFLRASSFRQTLVR